MKKNTNSGSNLKVNHSNLGEKYFSNNLQKCFTEKLGKSLLDIFQFIFRLIILVSADLIRIPLGQSLEKFFNNIIFYLIFLFSTSCIDSSTLAKTKSNNLFRNSVFTKKNLFFNFILIIVISETFCWMFKSGPINQQALAAIDIRQLLDEDRQLLFYLLYIIILIIIINILPVFKFYIAIPKVTLILSLFNIYFSFIFIISIIHDFNESNSVVLFEGDNSNNYYSHLKMMLFQKVNQVPKVLEFSQEKLKNLIIYQLESFPNEFMQNPIICPNLYNLSQRYEYISPLYVQNYASWTIGATFLMQCGLPQMMSDIRRWMHTKAKPILTIKCLPDILNSFGYKLNFATKGRNTIMEFNKWERARKFERIFTGKTDLEVINFINQKYLPSIDKEIRKNGDFAINHQLSKRSHPSRFFTFIQGQDTHVPYSQPSWCNGPFPKMSEKQKCYHCVDKLVGELVNKFLELKMNEHTLLVIVPDHMPWMPGEFKVNQLFILFPGMEKVNINERIQKDINYYDFAPTILDLIGIKKYVPQFPFGRNIYDLNQTGKNDTFVKHNKPDKDDFPVIYKFLNFDQEKKIYQI